MTAGLMDDLKDGCPDVLIPPGVPYLTGKFPLKILPYLTNLRLHGLRHAYLLLPRFPSFAGKRGKAPEYAPQGEVNAEAALLVEGNKDKLRSLICRFNIKRGIVEDLRHLSIQHQDHPTGIVEFF